VPNVYELSNDLSVLGCGLLLYVVFRSEQLSFISFSFRYDLAGSDSDKYECHRTLGYHAAYFYN
jgi:hypothetical protein